MKKTSFITGACAASMIALMGSCTVGNVAVDQVNTILAGNWYISQVNDSTVKSPDEEWPYLDLNTQQGSLSGNLGCNQVMGNFTFNDKGQIAFENLASTRMMCPEMSLEDAITSTLPNVRQYFYNKVTGTLTLSTAEGKPLIVMTRINPRTAEQYHQIY